MSTGLNMSFIEEQVHVAFDKLKITDNTKEISEQKELIKEYYRKKASTEPDTTKKHYEFVDLFCGAGGLSSGIEQAGFEPTLAIDKDETALRTYRFNRPNMDPNRIINEDIRNLDDADIFDYVPLVVGGPPCQGFSNANKQRVLNDERNILYKFYVKSVSKIRPEIFLMENVEGILAHYDEIKEDFLAVGYITLTPIILNTNDFGFPQSRKRAFILGVNERHKKIADELYRIFLDSIESHKGQYSFCLWDAISDLPQIKAKNVKNSTYLESAEWGYTFDQFRKLTTDYAKLVNVNSGENVPLLNHKSKFNNDRDIQIYGTLQPGENSTAESIQELNPYARRNGIFKDKFFKLQPDQPCKTITAHMYYDCHMYIHPYQARGLTPREAARIQGFPDDYFFLGSPNEWYRQIGNAVSPLLARILGEALFSVLQRIDNEDE